MLSMFLFRQKLLIDMENLTTTARNFILHWGEMGTKWGINRTVAQIHALLFISPEPLAADTICSTLGVARSNASISLRELQNWGIVRVVHLPNERKDHFESMKDVYEMFRVIANERKRREIDPTLSLIHDCLDNASPTEESNDAYAIKQLSQLREFFELVSHFHDTMNRLPTKTAIKTLRMGDKLLKTLSSFS